MACVYNKNGCGQPSGARSKFHLEGGEGYAGLVLQKQASRLQFLGEVLLLLLQGVKIDLALLLVVVGAAVADIRPNGCCCLLAVIVVVQ